jgi:hypothetical protein
VPGDRRYHTPAWRRLRAARLKIDRFTCIVSGCDARVTHVVDHIVFAPLWRSKYDSEHAVLMRRSRQHGERGRRRQTAQRRQAHRQKLSPGRDATRSRRAYGTNEDYLMARNIGIVTLSASASAGAITFIDVPFRRTHRPARSRPHIKRAIARSAPTRVTRARTGDGVGGIFLCPYCRVWVRRKSPQYRTSYSIARSAHSSAHHSPGGTFKKVYAYRLMDAADSPIK